MLRGFAIIKIHKISETEIVACYGKKKTSNIEQDYFYYPKYLKKGISLMYM